MITIGTRSINGKFWTLYQVGASKLEATCVDCSFSSNRGATNDDADFIWDFIKRMF
jgi:hypothetical protein